MKYYIIHISSPVNLENKWSVGITAEGDIEVEGNPDMGEVAKTFWNAFSKEGTDVFNATYRMGYQAKSEEIEACILKEPMNFVKKIKEKLKDYNYGLQKRDTNLEEWIWGTDVEKLIDIIEDAMKVIDFYGDPLTYVSNSGKIGITPIYTNDCENIKGTSGTDRFCGGKRARDLLKKIETLK